MTESDASERERLRRALDIFRESLVHDGAAREAFIAKACDGDPILSREVWAYLEEETSDHGPVEPGAGMAVLARAVTPEAVTTQMPVLPVVSGNYRLHRILGQGAMGTVWLAEQQSPRRLVAVKVVRRDLASKSAWKRFSLEADVLGRLHHPGIAQIFEAGELGEGRPDEAYIVMEYIDGCTPNDYAEKLKLDVRGRVDLVRQMCEAVQHAHQRGVIHRDLKPSNMLVTHGGVLKVLDFGVARMVDADAEMTSVHTRAGQIVGTLSYMSPEQVSGLADDVDTRADIYALGVVAYQLLSGRLPYDVASRPIPEAARIICEVEPPRLGTVSPTLRGDLDVIVSRAMQKERDRRYAAAADLADDLRRHLEGLPIVARQDSVLYLLRRSAARHRTIVAAGLIVIALIAAFGIHSKIQARRFAEIAESESSARKSAEEARAGESAAKEALAVEAENLRRSLYTARIGYALAALAESDMGQVRRQLADCAPDVRNWEWHYLSALCEDATSKLVIGQVGKLWIQGGDESKEFVCIAGNSDSVIVDVDSMEILHSAPVPNSASFPVYDPTTKTLRLRVHQGATQIAMVSGESKRLDAESAKRLVTVGCDAQMQRIVANVDGVAVIVDVRTMDDMIELDLDREKPTEAIFDRSERRVFVACEDGYLRVCDAIKGTLLSERKVAANGLVHLCLSDDDQLLAVTVSKDEWIHIFDAADLRPIKRLKPHRGRATSIAFVPNSGRLVSGGVDSTIRVTDIESEAEVRCLRGHDHAVTFLMFPHRGSTLLSGAWDGTLRRWDDIERPRPPVWKLGTDSMLCAASSPDGREVWVSTGDGDIHVVDASDGRVLRKTRMPTTNLWGLARTRGPFPWAVGGTDGKLRFVKDDLTISQREVDAHQSTIFQLAVSEDGRLVASTSGDDRLVVVDAVDEQVPPRIFAPFAGGAKPRACRFLADGRHVLVGTSMGDLIIWSLESEREVWRTSIGNESIMAVDMTPDQETIVAAIVSGNVAIVPRDGRDATYLAAHKVGARCLAINGAGDRLITGGSDGLVRIWELPSGREVLTLEGHDSFVFSLHFSSDDRFIYSSGVDGTLRQRGY